MNRELKEKIKSVIESYMTLEELTWYKLVDLRKQYPPKFLIGVGTATLHKILRKNEFPSMKSIVSILSTIKKNQPHLVEDFIITEYQVSYEKKQV